MAMASNLRPAMASTLAMCFSPWTSLVQNHGPPATPTWWLDVLVFFVFFGGSVCFLWRVSLFSLEGQSVFWVVQDLFRSSSSCRCCKVTDLLTEWVRPGMDVVAQAGAG